MFNATKSIYMLYNPLVSSRVTSSTAKEATLINGLSHREGNFSCSQRQMEISPTSCYIRLLYVIEVGNIIDKIKTMKFAI